MPAVIKRVVLVVRSVVFRHRHHHHHRRGGGHRRVPDTSRRSQPAARAKSSCVRQFMTGHNRCCPVTHHLRRPPSQWRHDSRYRSNRGHGGAAASFLRGSARCDARPHPPFAVSRNINRCSLARTRNNSSTEQIAARLSVDTPYTRVHGSVSNGRRHGLRHGRHFGRAVFTCAGSPYT